MSERKMDAWMHICQHDDDCDAEPGAVISAKSKELWMSIGPSGAKWVEHYTIPLYAAPAPTPTAELWRKWLYKVADNYGITGVDHATIIEAAAALEAAQAENARLELENEQIRENEGNATYVGEQRVRQLENGYDTLRTALHKAEARARELEQALEQIAAIEDQMVGSDWEEIEQARTISRTALAARKEEGR
jgi:hypothetical protein